VPDDYEEQLRYYTHHGYRVLAVAWKQITKEPVSNVLKMERESIESGLRFLGFIIFENKLKPGTLPVVRTLNKASIRQVMCTGDNILTSVSVSRECELIREGQRVFVPRFVSGHSNEENAVMVWEDVDDPKFQLNPITFLPLYNDTPGFSRQSSSSIGSTLPTGDYVLAITGEAFQWMLDFSSDEVFERVSFIDVDVSQVSNLCSHVTRSKAFLGRKFAVHWILCRLLWGWNQ
jgi:cation-transporting ATPase 13A3/4/5